jgi:hypothetical protein
MKDYLDDILVWAIFFAILFPILLVLRKRSQIAILVFGLLVFIAAFPISAMADLSINGCCGGPSTGYEWAGYLIGGVIAIAGILLMTFSKKLSKK